MHIYQTQAMLTVILIRLLCIPFIVGWWFFSLWLKTNLKLIFVFVVRPYMILTHIRRRYTRSIASRLNAEPWPIPYEKDERDDKRITPGRRICDDILFDVLEFLPPGQLAAVASASRSVHKMAPGLLARPGRLHRVRATVVSAYCVDGQLKLRIHYHRPSSQMLHDVLFGPYIFVNYDKLKEWTFLRFNETHIYVSGFLYSQCDYFRQLTQISHVWNSETVFVISDAMSYDHFLDGFAEEISWHLLRKKSAGAIRFIGPITHVAIGALVCSDRYNV